jgi:phosphoglycolate phosphatase
MKLLIFDIDGTLTSLDGATTRAYGKAFNRVFGRDMITDGLTMHGRTDPLIFRHCYYKSGLTGDWREGYETFKPPYLEELPISIRNSPKARMHVGVRELLDALSESPEEFALALGTGNMEAGGRTKIAHFDLNRYFPIGGFGDHHEERHMILQDALDSAEEYFGTTFSPETSWVIGDTEFDIYGAQKLGIKTLAVATGGKYTVEMLREHGADAAREDLSDTAGLLELFRS